MRNILIETRKKFGYTQTFIAEYLGMAANSYQRIEYGQNGTNEENWIKLFELFDKKTALHKLMKNDKEN